MVTFPDTLFRADVSITQQLGLSAAGTSQLMGIQRPKSFALIQDHSEGPSQLRAPCKMSEPLLHVHSDQLPPLPNPLSLTGVSPETTL